MRFRRYAGSPQLQIDSFETLAQAVQEPGADGAGGLPEALWVVLSIPLDSLVCDPVFLSGLDTDRNGRIRVEELRAGVAWVRERLRVFSGVDSGSEVLALAHLADNPAGAALREAALLILESQGSPALSAITLTQIRQSGAELRQDHINGDGILAPESLEPGASASAGAGAGAGASASAGADPALAALLREAVACLPPKQNRAGQAGADEELLLLFQERCDKARAHLAAQAEIFCWGDGSEAVAARWLALEAPLERYWQLCRLLAAQPQVAGSLQVGQQEAAAVFGAAGAAGADRIAQLLAVMPVAALDPAGVLRWDRLVRGPYWEQLCEMGADLPAGADGTVALAEAQWRERIAAARRVQAWRAAEQADPFCRLQRVRGPDDLQTGPQIQALIARSRLDLARRDELAAVADLERLALSQKWLLRLARNFISMSDLYPGVAGAPDSPDARPPALFERGSLIIAGREFMLSVLVPDRAAHAKLAEQSSMCIAYVRVEAGNDAEGRPIRPPFEVAVPITAGTSEGIVEGRRGLFYASDGRSDSGAGAAIRREYDAVITQVILQPVSLWEAMIQPFGRIASFLRDRVQEISGSGDRQLEAGISSAWEKTAGAQKAPAAGGAGVSGIVAAGGVAFAAISSSVAYVLSELERMTLMGLLQSVAALVLLVMVPSGIAAWLKLRQRNLAVLLEGSGWAMNDRLLLTRELGQLFTRRPSRPQGAVLEKQDEVHALLRTLKARDHQDIDESRESTLLAVVACLLLFLAISSYWDRILPWVVAAAQPEPAEVAPEAPAPTP